MAWLSQLWSWISYFSVDTQTDFTISLVSLSQLNTWVITSLALPMWQTRNIMASGLAVFLPPTPISCGSFSLWKGFVSVSHCPGLTAGPAIQTSHIGLRRVGLPYPAVRRVSVINSTWYYWKLQTSTLVPEKDPHSSMQCADTRWSQRESYTLYHFFFHNET